MAVSRRGGSAIARVIILGGGLAGLSAACALAEAGLSVILYEKRPELCGRAGSFVPRGGEAPIDYCQHILMRCCTNLLDFCARLDVTEHISFRRRLCYLDRQGRTSILAGSPLPAPMHFLPSFLRLPFLRARDKAGIGRAFVAMLQEPSPEEDFPFTAWLAKHRQTCGAIADFWRPVVVSALNEEMERVSTSAVLQVFRDGFLRNGQAYEVGIPDVPLGELYGPAARAYLSRRGGEIVCRTAASALRMNDGRITGVVLADGSLAEADYYLCAVPAYALPSLLPPSLAAQYESLKRLESAPIVAIHLWFDRPVTDLDHAALVGRPIHWVFNKSRQFSLGSGEYLSLVVSAARDLMPRPQREITALALRELGEAFPAARDAALRQAVVTKEQHATFAPLPGGAARRPSQQTPVPNLFLAGDYTQTGWPATMEGAVRSGYRAAEAVLAAAGMPKRLLVPDLPAAPLTRLLARGNRG